MPGELRGDHVIIHEQSEANRIYNKGGYGRPLSGGGLELDLVEAAYLCDAGRLALRPPHEERASFFAEAAHKRPEFGVQYVAYRELRDQHALLRLASPELRRDGIEFRIGTDGRGGAAAYVQCRSERTPEPLRDLKDLADRCSADGVRGMVAVVDEESEVTTYEVTRVDPRGRRPPLAGDRQEGVLLGDRVFLPRGRGADRLHEAEFFGKAVPGGYHLSLVEAVHLAGRDLLALVDPARGRTLRPEELHRLARRVEPDLDLRHAVYEDLKSRRLVVKTGYKFGTHFRAYEDEPTATHAPFLVEAAPAKKSYTWPELSRAIRLAHGVRKHLVIAQSGKDGVQYVGIARLA